MPDAAASRRAPRSAGGVSAAPAGSAADCAAAVIETVPAAMDWLRQAMRRHVGDEISVPQFRCLAFVDRQPGCSVGDVAAFLGVTMPTASAMVERLVRSGSVRSRADASDRRRAELRVTRPGHVQLGQIRRRAHDEFTRTLAPVAEADLAALQAGLRVLRRVLQVP
jgi:DNA-binding MarR family transcriptional regulator